MKKYILYSHDGSANHGCEAIVRTTAELLDYNKNSITVISTRPEEDFEYGIDKICRIKQRGQTIERVRKNLSFLKAYYNLKIKHNYEMMDNLVEMQEIEKLNADVAIAIGGDSYCYGKTMTDLLIREHNIFRSLGLKTVFWGCSIEPELLNDPKIVSDFSSFDLITARESISYEALKLINPNTILVADSAFILQKECLPMPTGFEGCDIVGMNVSPLVEGLEKESGIVRRNYEHLIEAILNETNYKILLIPHVTWAFNNDRVVLQKLLQKYNVSGRIAIIDDCNCQQIKGYISRCRYFFGARTHATIAAYSTYVPTIVLGYSTKAKGIAKDLFGTYENYVVSTQSLIDEYELVNKWEWLQENENDYREKLCQIIPNYIQRVYDGKNSVQKL